VLRLSRASGTVFIFYTGSYEFADNRAFRGSVIPENGSWRARRARVITLRMRDSPPAVGLRVNAITVYSNLYHRHLRADKSRPQTPTLRFLSCTFSRASFHLFRPAAPSSLGCRVLVYVSIRALLRARLIRPNNSRRVFSLYNQQIAKRIARAAEISVNSVLYGTVSLRRRLTRFARDHWACSMSAIGYRCVPSAALYSTCRWYLSNLSILTFSLQNRGWLAGWISRANTEHVYH